MMNPTYAGDFKERPERISYLNITGVDGHITLSVGIKTLTHNRRGLQIIPHDVIVVEMTEGDDVLSFDMPARFAKAFAERMMGFAHKLEKKND